jgi:4-amino-4-deoxy-L-arabinose transferase-like glycosyltransferase
MIPLLIWLGVLLACFGVGTSLLARWGARAEDLLDELPFSVALGMGILSYLALALGLLGQIRAWVFIAVVLILALVGWRQIVRLARGLAGCLARPKRPDWFTLPLAAFLLVMGVLTLIGALSPSADIDYDGLVYHLTLPKVYIHDGRIHAIPWLSHSNFPFLLEMLYMLGLLFQGQSLAKLFHFGCGWLAVFAVFSFGRWAWGRRAGWLGAALLAAIPLVAWEMISAYNELAFTLYAFLAIFAFSRWSEGRREGEGNGWLWVAAIMCGFAMGSKALAGVVLAFGALAILAHVRLRQKEGLLAPLIGFVAIAAAVASPWYIKSYLWTGNPVYPFAYGIFDGRYWTPDRAQLYTIAQKEFGMGTGPLAFLALPWNLTMNSYRFFDIPGHLRPVNVLVWVFGPVLLATVPTLLVTRQVRSAGRVALWFAAFYIAIWFSTSQNARYLIPILPGLCACAGLALDRMLSRRGLLPAAAALVLSLALLSALYSGYNLASPAWRVAFGLESQSDYLSGVSEVYRMSEGINHATPPDAKIIVFGDEPRLFYLDREFLLGNHAAIFSPADIASPDALTARFGRMGITHILIGASMLQDMAAGKGAIERDLAGMEVQGRIRPLGMYGTLSLWQLVGQPKPSAR